MTDSHVNVTWIALEVQAFSPLKEWQHLQWLEANYPDCYQSPEIIEQTAPGSFCAD